MSTLDNLPANDPEFLAHQARIANLSFDADGYSWPPIPTTSAVGRLFGFDLDKLPRRAASAFSSQMELQGCTYEKTVTVAAKMAMLEAGVALEDANRFVTEEADIIATYVEELLTAIDEDEVESDHLDILDAFDNIAKSLRSGGVTLYNNGEVYSRGLDEGDFNVLALNAYCELRVFYEAATRVAIDSAVPLIGQEGIDQ